jgi:hypothetical protein
VIPDRPILRAAHASDAPALATLIRLCFAAHRVDPPPSALVETPASVAGQIVRGGGVVAEQPAGPAEPVGAVFLSLACCGRSARPGSISRALPCIRYGAGKGLARALIGADEAEARRGLPRLHLGTRLALSDNRRLFTACGFVECGLHAHPGYAAPTWVSLEKRLG